MNRNVTREGEKLVTFFVDLRVAFDMIDRKILLMTIREREVKERLVRRCGDLYRKTRNKIKAGER